MNTQIKNTIKTLVLATVMVLGMSQINAEDWSEPAGAAPGWNNTGSINKSQFSENKIGSLAIGYESLEDSGIEETGFKIDANGAFASRGIFASGALTTTEGVMVGMLPVDSASRIIVGGKIGIGVENPQEGVHLGEGTTIRMEELAHSGSDLTICADVNGTLILCPVPGELFAIITGPTVTDEDNFLDGFENNSPDNNCSADVAFSGSATGGIVGAGYTYSWRVKNNADTPVMMINDSIWDAGVWKDLGAGAAKSFSVDVKNPASYGRDDWTIELSVTDATGTTAVSESNFTVWDDAEGCY